MSAARHIRIGDLARVFHPGGGAKVISVLQAGFDASFVNRAPGITAVAGYVAPLDAWESIEGPWRDGCRDWKIPYFRASELNSWMDLHYAELCTLSFARIIKESHLSGIGAAVVDEDWLEPNWGPLSIPKLGSLYEQALHEAFLTLGDHAQRNFPGEEVAVLCCADCAEEKIESVFKKVRKVHPQFCTVSIGSAKKILPLQCADLAASRLRVSWMSLVKGEDDDLPWGDFPIGRAAKIQTSIISQRMGSVLFRLLDKIWESRSNLKLKN